MRQILVVGGLDSVLFQANTSKHEHYTQPSKRTCWRRRHVRSGRSKILSTQSILYYYYYYNHPPKQTIPKIMFPKSLFQDRIPNNSNSSVDYHHHLELGWLTYMLYVILRDITMKGLLLTNHVVMVPIPMLIDQRVN